MNAVVSVNVGSPRDASRRGRNFASANDRHCTGSLGADHPPLPIQLLIRKIRKCPKFQSLLSK